MKLTKKFQIVYKEGKMIRPLTEMPEGSISYVGKGVQGAEFDSLEEAQAFVSDNNLIYEQVKDENAL